MNQFLQEVLKGLTAKEKYLQSKYFYNEAGDNLFQQIMKCPEYYLTRCEMEIFAKQKSEIATALLQNSSEVDIIELGAGDATKSIYLLQELAERRIDFTYYPIDISSNVISVLETDLPKKVDGIKVKGLNGEYLPMLTTVKSLTNKTKVVLFLGSNIGNIPPHEAGIFCRSIRDQLNVGDLLFIGVDLKKNPQVILNAYNDKTGLTRDFNLNLLTRINEELGSDFNCNNFQHYPTYDPATGTCKSYLIAATDHEVQLDGQLIGFAEGEPVHTEISQKYTVEQIEKLAIESSFIVKRNFFDSKRWFIDSLWEAV